MIVDFRRNPPALLPTEWVESFRFLGSTIFQDLNWDNHIEKGPAEAVLPSPAEDVQPATGAAETVLLCYHWIRPLHVNICLVQLSFQIWPQKTTEGSPDCWANHWYNPPHSPGTVLIQSVQNGWSKSLWTPHIQHTPSLNCYRLVKATELWVPERPDTETVSFLKQSISWTLDIKHSIYTLIYLTHILSLHFNCNIIYLYIQLSICILFLFTCSF